MDVICLVLVVLMVVIVITTADHSTTWIHCSYSSFAQQLKKLWRQQIAAASRRALSTSPMLGLHPPVFYDSRTHAGGG